MDHARAHDAVRGHVPEAAAGQIPRALHEVGVAARDRLEQRGNLERVVLVVARVNHEDVVAVIQRV